MFIKYIVEEALDSCLLNAFSIECLLDSRELPQRPLKQWWYTSGVSYVPELRQMPTASFTKCSTKSNKTYLAVNAERDALLNVFTLVKRSISPPKFPWGIKCPVGESNSGRCNHNASY
jgi:hypothetical protein